MPHAGIIVLHTFKSGILVSLQDSFIELDLVMIVEVWRTSTVVHLNVGCDGARLVIVLQLLDSCSRLYFHFFLYFLKPSKI